MQREIITPRPDWRESVEALGFDFHTIDGKPYWREDACYRFTAAEVDELDDATSELHGLCLDAVDRIVRAGRYQELGLDAAAAALVERSWHASEPALYGRMDLAYDGKSPPKLLEYNADTPTALFEASVVQWHWLEGTHCGADQFNSIHEKLIARWPQVCKSKKIHFAAFLDQAEDRATCEYLRDTCVQAGFDTTALHVDDIGWSGSNFIGLDNEVMQTLFKLYPWEWMLSEEFGKHLPAVDLRWIEPAWKMLLSNKSVLPLLWEFYPGHPNLLPAAYRRVDLSGTLVRKPRYGREGEGISTLRAFAAEPVTDESVVYQAYNELPCFDGNYALVGSWLVGHESAGIGLREDRDPVTRNTSCFVPHCFD